MKILSPVASSWFAKVFARAGRLGDGILEVFVKQLVKKVMPAGTASLDLDKIGG